MDRSREYALETHYSRLRSNTLWRYNLCTVVSHIRRSSGNENYDIQVSKRYKKESWKRLVEVIGFGLFMIPFKFWWCCTRMYILPRVIETLVKLSLERCWPIIECRRPSTGRNSKNENVLSSFLFFFFLPLNLQIIIIENVFYRGHFRKIRFILYLGKSNLMSRGIKIKTSEKSKTKNENEVEMLRFLNRLSLFSSLPFGGNTMELTFLA